MVRLPNYDYYEGYRRAVQGLLDGTYLNPEQMWLDYSPDVPEFTDKDLFIEGVQQAFKDIKQGIMFIKIEPKSETEKAYQLQNGSWIPKSILDNRGLKHPYYKVKGWWLDKMYDKAIEEGNTSAEMTLLELESLVINFINLPKDIIDYWAEYWRGQLSDHQSDYDMEPRLWGNDCFEGEMSSRF